MQKIFLSFLVCAASLFAQSPAPSSVVIIKQVGPPGPKGDKGDPGRDATGAPPALTNLQLAIDTLPPNGSLHIPAAVYTITTPLLVNNRHDISLVCDPGTGITSLNAQALLISGSTEITVDGCGLTPQSGSFPFQITNSTGIHIRHNSIRGETNVYSSSFVQFKDNPYLGAIFGQDNLDQIQIDGNVIHGGTALHTYTAGAHIAGVQFTNNMIYGEGSEFCLEIGAFSSWTAPAVERPTDLVITGNICKLVAGSMYGGYSLSQVSGYTLSGNHFLRAVTTGASLAAVELVSADHGTVGNNILIGRGISLDGSSDVTIQGNVVTGGSGLEAGVSRPGANLQRNVITGNHFEEGLRIQCNYPGAVCGDNTVAHNTFIGVGTAITNENDLATGPTPASMLENIFDHNKLIGFATCFGDSGSNTKFLGNSPGGCIEVPLNDPTVTITH